MTRSVATIPNILTLGRVALIPVFVVASLQGAFALAFFAFLIAALTDIVDGWLARRLNQHSRLGAILDPAADKVMLISGYIVFTIPTVATHTLPLGLTFTVFSRDVLIVFFAYLLYTRINISRFPPTIPGKISTVCQVVALAVTIASNMFLAPIALPLLWLSHQAALVMTLFSGLHYLRKWNAEVTA